MLKELLKHEEYYQFGGVWMDKFQHPEGRYTEITNTNKLIRFYEGCDGGKTGFTSEAGFCLAATAKRNDMRIISVIIGAENSKNRFDDTRTMFDYAFANYMAKPIVQANVPLEQTIKVNGGKEKEIQVYPAKSVYNFVKRGETANVSYEMLIEKAKAPVEKDEKVGELLVFKDGVEIDRVDLKAVNQIQKAGFFDRLQDIAENWNSR